MSGLALSHPPLQDFSRVGDRSGLCASDIDDRGHGGFDLVGGVGIDDQEEFVSWSICLSTDKLRLGLPDPGEGLAKRCSGSLGIAVGARFPAMGVRHMEQHSGLRLDLDSLPDLLCASVAFVNLDDLIGH